LQVGRAYRPNAVTEPEAESTEDEQSSAGSAARATFTPPALQIMPPLAAVAAVAAVLDLFLRRGLLRTISDRLERSEARVIGPWLEVPMNLAAIAGTVAVTVGLFRLLASRLHAPWNRPPALVRFAEAAMRAVTAGFAGILLPSVVIATFFPAERTTGPTVFAAAAAAYLLVLQVAFMGSRARGPIGVRLATVLLGVSALGGFLALFVGELGPQLGWARAYEAYRLVSVVGELCFLALPLAILPTVIPRRGTPRMALAIYVGTSLGLSAMVTFDVWRVYLGPSYDAVLYGAVRFETFLGAMGVVYALPFGLFIGLGFGALASSRPIDRQLGAAILALFAAGFGPRTPAQLLMMVLGATLLGRAAIAEALAKTYGTADARS
jgi:hypothetical protein